MTRKMMRKKAIEAIRTHGVLLVYPIDNRQEPNSIWRCLFPRTKMVWEWDDESDSRVADVWHLRAELSNSNEVVYTKWHQGRATFFSRELFTALLKYLGAVDQNTAMLPHKAQEILETLLMDSPQSTKQIKQAVELQGRYFESTYNRAMKRLWDQLLIVGYGEIEDSSFPSLAVGASQTIYEELWQGAQAISMKEAEATVRKFFAKQPAFARFLGKVKRTVDASAELSPTE